VTSVAILGALLFLVGFVGSDICFGQLLKREYTVARDDWIRDGRPTWWTWRPLGQDLPQWYYYAPRWRWLVSSPP